MGDVGQVLDLAHDVVAEVADEPAVQRRQLGQRRRPVDGEQGLDGGQDAAGRGGTERRDVAVDLDPAAAGDERGRRRPADERPAAPALAVLDRLEQEARAPSPAAQPAEGGDRRDQVGEQLAPHGHDGVVAGQGAELVPARAEHGVQPPPAAEGPEEAGALAGVAGAPPLLLDHEQQRVAVAVVVRLADPLAVARGVALAPLLLAGPAPEHGPALVEGLPQGAAAFIHAIIRTSPVPRSCTMAGTRPSAS